MSSGYAIFIDEIGKRDTAFAGGKGANLGEMYRAHLPVPEAFVVTTKAHDLFAKSCGIERTIEELLSSVDVDDIGSLEREARKIRALIESFKLPGDVAGEIIRNYEELSRRADVRELRVAVRSSATAEDLREASFAGQQSTLLNVRGRKALLAAIRTCWASVYTARAIFYRVKKGFGSHAIPTAVVVQKQISSEKAGVGFTIHPLTGDERVVVIEAGPGQGESVVSGSSTPDTFVLSKEDGKLLESRIAHKSRMKLLSRFGSGLVNVAIPASRSDLPCLNSSEVRTLWKLARSLEDHYGFPQDFEWAIEKGRAYLVQTRAVTVTKREARSEDVPGEKPLLKGLGASPGWATGTVRLVLGIGDLEEVKQGDVLVAAMTTPDFVPAMMKTAAIVTDEGGMTSHAAIVSRELGVPCVVGTFRATKLLEPGTQITIDGSRGLVFRGSTPPPKRAAESAEDAERARNLVTGAKIYMNLGVPEKISDYAKLPFDGIGLMRVEFIIASHIGEHPLHLIESGNEERFVDKLAAAVAIVARAISPRPLVVRFSDFKSNEYRELEGGEKYEDVEANPMLGWRGASRYVSPEYLDAFRLEIRAIKKVRQELELKNVWVMLPFVRTVSETERCIKILSQEGLERSDSFKIWLMAEVPSVIFMADKFARLCDGFSIGSNDLTQLILGIDRDSGKLAKLGYFDERDEALKIAMRMLIESAHRYGKTVSICGQAPSVYPDLAEYLVRLGIDSLSVNPDTVIKTRVLVHKLENEIAAEDEARWETSAPKIQATDGSS